MSLPHAAPHLGKLCSPLPNAGFSGLADSNRAPPPPPLPLPPQRTAPRPAPAQPLRQAVAPGSASPAAPLTKTLRAAAAPQQRAPPRAAALPPGEIALSDEYSGGSLGAYPAVYEPDVASAITSAQLTRTRAQPPTSPLPAAAASEAHKQERSAPALAAHTPELAAHARGNVGVLSRDLAVAVEAPAAPARVSGPASGAETGSGQSKRPRRLAHGLYGSAKPKQGEG